MWSGWSAHTRPTGRLERAIVRSVPHTTHPHSRDNRGTVATTFHHAPHPLHPSGYQPSKLPARSGKVKPQHQSNTQSRELPRYLSRTARESVGDTFHYPHHAKPRSEAKYARKKHHLHSVQNLHSLHAHSNSCNRAKHRELHDCTKRNTPPTIHGYSPATRLF